MSAAAITLPIRVPDDERLLIDVAREAVARGLHLVIDRFGNVLMTPRLWPGMTRIYTVDKEAA